MRWIEIKKQLIVKKTKPAFVVSDKKRMDEAGEDVEQIQELDSPQVDAENKRIERLNTQKKVAQIKKKQLKLRDDQAALAKLRREK